MCVPPSWLDLLKCLYLSTATQLCTSGQVSLPGSAKERKAHCCIYSSVIFSKWCCRHRLSWQWSNHLKLGGQDWIHVCNIKVKHTNFSLLHSQNWLKYLNCPEKEIKSLLREKIVKFIEFVVCLIFACFPEKRGRVTYLSIRAFKLLSSKIIFLFLLSDCPIKW